MTTAPEHAPGRPPGNGHAPRAATAAADGWATRHAGLVAAVAVGLALRLAVVAVWPDMVLNGDEMDFATGARQLAAGEEVAVFPFRPPLYIAFGAAALRLFGPSIDAIRVAQIVVDALTIVGLYLLALRALGRRAAAWAAWIWAVFPDAIVYSHSIWSETLTLSLMVYGVLLLAALHERPAWPLAAATGLAWGLVALVKPYNIYLFPLLLAWLVWASAPPARARAARAAAAALLAGVVTITPWSIVASRMEGRPVVICTAARANLVRGVNYAPPPHYDFANEWDLSPARRRAFPQREVGVAAFILQEPGLFLRRSVEKASYLWSPNSNLVRYLLGFEAFRETGFPPGTTTKYGNPRTMWPSLRLAAIYATMGATVAVTLGFLFGVFRTRHRVLDGLTATYCLAYMAMITLTPAMSRYRMPLMIFAALYAGAAFARRATTPRSRLQLAGLVTCLAALAALWAMRVPGLVSAIW